MQVNNKNLLSVFPYSSQSGITYISKGKDRFTTYSSLYYNALKYLYVFQENGLSSGDEFVFFLDNNEDFVNCFWACVFGGIIPVPISTGNSIKNVKKLINISRSLNAPTLLVDSKNLKAINGFSFDEEENEVLEELKDKLINVDSIELTEKYGTIKDSLPDDIAFIQFSSGSTGRPKGVTLTHKNLLTNIQDIIKGTNATVEDRVLSWMPLTHDMGLIGFHLSPLVCGCNQWLMPASLFVSKPLFWLEKIEEYSINVTSSPNFGYRHVLKRLKTRKFNRLNLTSLRLILNGAEPISAPVVNEFLDKLEPFGLKRTAMFPVYGLAEASLAVTMPPVEEEMLSMSVARDSLTTGSKISQSEKNAITFVDLGYPMAHIAIRIVANDQSLLDEQHIGIIQIAGENVTNGYYNEPEVSSAAFSDDGWFDTGDLGFIKNNRLFVTGREKDILFSNGINFYAHDIEESVESIIGMTSVCCGVFNETVGQDEIVVFLIFRKSLDLFIPFIRKTKESLFKSTGLHVDRVLPVESIPRTTSGKVQRYVLASKYFAGEFDELIKEIESREQAISLDLFEEIKDKDELLIGQLWKSNLELTSLGRHDNFFEIGGDSITVFRLLTDIEQQTGVSISFAEFFDHPTVSSLSDLIKTKEKIRSTYPVIEPDPGNHFQPFPLTGVQMAYLMGRSEEFELGGISTHGYYEFETELDMSRLNHSLNCVIQKHPMLRTVFTDQSKQILLKKVPEYVIAIQDISHLTETAQQDCIQAERDRMSHHVFDEQQWPLFEFKAFKINECQHYLFVGIDLLIVDGASIQNLLSEIMVIYHNPDKKIGHLEFTFRDYILALENFRNGDTFKRDKSFWLEKLDNFPTYPEVPIRVNPNMIRKPRFNRKSHVFSSSQYARMKTKAMNANVTISSLLCTAYAKVLSLWSNQPHFALSVTLFNRIPFHAEVDKIIGDFTSIIPLDIKFSATTAMEQDMREIQKQISVAIDHRHFDGIDFIRALAQHRKIDRQVVLPYVFTCMLMPGANKLYDISQLGKIKSSISQTSQVFLDHQVMEINGELFLTWDYVEALFENDVISGMFEAYISILNQLITDNELCQPLLSKKDNQMITDFNHTESDIEPTTLTALLAAQVKQTPDAVAIKKGSVSITFKELDKKSNQVAYHLIQEGIGRTHLVGINAVRTPETLINIVGILKSGAAYVPIDPDYPENRRNYITENSDCKLVMTPDYYIQNDLQSLPTTSLDIFAGPKDVAYVIYTSGSTGVPKGVVITHRAVTNTILDINERFGVTNSDRIIGLSSMGFDLSVYDIFGAFSTGATLVLIDDIRDMDQIVTTLRTEKITIWNSVPAVMDLMLNHMEKSDNELNYWEVDNNSDLCVNFEEDGFCLRLVLLSGDWIPLNLPNKIAARFDSELFSLGGATEASIWSIYFPVKAVEPEWKSIPYGYPLANQHFYVLDYEQRVCPVGVEGELYIGGFGLSEGYLNNPEKTREAFIQHPQLGSLYRTGDYGRMQPGGHLEFLGRKDQQVKVRGHRIELGEIEAVLNDHPQIRESIVDVKRCSGGTSVLVAYILSETEALQDDHYQSFKQFLEQQLPVYMVPQRFIQIASIPLTANGKVDRKSLPSPDSSDSESVVVKPGNKVEHSLLAMWESVLGVTNISIHDNFFEVGGDSISMVQIAGRITKEFNVSLSYRDLLHADTIARLAKLISRETPDFDKTVYPVAVPDITNKYDPFPLTEVQFAYLMGRESAFEMGGVSTHAYYEIETSLDVERFNNSLNLVIQSQPMLRAVIHKNGTQQFLENVPLYKIEIEDLRALSVSDQEARIKIERDRMSHHMFNTEEWPLFEFKAFRRKDSGFYLCAGIDLLIADGTSMHIMIREILDAYHNSEEFLSGLDFTFRDYVQTYQQFKASDIYARDKAYWMSKIESIPDAPCLPLKSNPENLAQPHFDRLHQVIPKKIWDEIKAYAKQHTVSPSALLCSIYTHVLSAWSNQEALTVNLTVFNRYPFHKDVNRLIGDFTSVILLAVDLSKDEDFWSQTKALQYNLLEALDHRHFDGIETIRELSRLKGVGTKAVMPVVFTSILFSLDNEKADDRMDNWGEFKLGNSQTSQVYLDYQAMENNGDLWITWDYVRELFDKTIINEMFEEYLRLLATVITGQTISTKLPALSTQVLDDYNRTNEAIQPTTLVSLFSKQAEKTPDSIVVKKGSAFFTFAQLDKITNQIANSLNDSGIVNGDYVGIYGERDIWTIANILGALKAGAAYVPIDPIYPESRQKYIRANSNCKIMLRSDYYHKNQIHTKPDGPAVSSINNEDPAYAIYTSGSTGQPKGVVVTHKSVTNTIIDINQKFAVTEQDRILGLSSLGFDLSIYDIFGAFSSGATLVLIDDIRDIVQIRELLHKEKITIWNSVPAVMGLLTNMLERELDEMMNYWEVGADAETVSVAFEEAVPLRLVLLSGDWIPLDLPQAINSVFPKAQVISLGGATEASIWSIYFPISKIGSDWVSIPYGTPLSNQTIYILNSKMKRCPIGVVGEIFIGGVGVAKEYLNDPEKSALAFIKHPQLGTLYKTGDFGVMRAAGYVEFLGRKDFQVKIGGFRIELGEIESRLIAHPSLERVLVVDYEDQNKNKFLCAYYIGQGIEQPETLRQFLANDLPEYMIPAHFIRLDSFPLTPNGKIDRKALVMPDQSLKTHSYVPPRSDLEREIALLWQETLGLDQIGIYDNFFDLGGDSIKGIKIFTILQEKYDITINQLFQSQTIHQLAETLVYKEDNFNKRLEQLKQEYFITQSEEDSFSPLIEKEFKQYLDAIKTQDNGVDKLKKTGKCCVLLTGVTGFLGSYLLKDILETTDSEVYVLIRQPHPEKRLLDTLSFYFNEDFYSNHKHAIHIVHGDITQERLGIESEIYQTLSKTIDKVIHSAADVSHFGVYEHFEKINISPINRLVSFCKEGKNKSFYHMSTTRVASGAIPNVEQVFFSEQQFNQNQIIDDFYSKSKLKAENLVLAAREKGVDTSIFRIGTIVFDSDTGKFQKNINQNSFYLIMRSILNLGIMPDLDSKILDLSYIDYVSKAIITLIFKGELRNKIYHIYNPHKLTMSEFHSLLKQSGVSNELSIMSFDTFVDHIMEIYSSSPNKEDIDNLLVQSGSYLSLEGTRFIVVNNQTENLLSRYGFKWPKPNLEHVSKMISYAREKQFLN